MVPRWLYGLTCIFWCSLAISWTRHPRRTLTRQQAATGHCDVDNLQELATVLSRQGVIGTARDRLLQSVEGMGWQSSQELVSFAKDFQSQPESISSILMVDFGMTALDAHRLRAAMTELMAANTQQAPSPTSPLRTPTPANHMVTSIGTGILSAYVPPPAHADTTKAVNRPTFKAYKVIMSRKQSLRETSYGMKDCDMSDALVSELDDFLEFMITPSPKNQEPPMRRTTAVVYCRHARLFLGWFLTSGRHDELNQRIDIASPSLNMLFPDKTRDGAAHAYAFIMWLRETRKISVSYEANLLRGLIKLCKFLFRNASQTDPAAYGYYTKKTYEDIPAVGELRRLHLQANRKQSTSPRVSDERRKWLSWTEFLSVVSHLQADVEGDLRSYESSPPLKTTVSASIRRQQTNGSAGIRTNETASTASRPPTAREVASKFQKYLILAFFSVVPDRQRTIRELAIGTTFQREDDTGTWQIKHGPDDYKTGKSYGDRPPMVIPMELTPAIGESNINAVAARQKSIFISESIRFAHVLC